MLLLPEEVGEKGFLESRFPTFRIDSSRKDMRRTGFEDPDWRQKAEMCSGSSPAVKWPVHEAIVYCLSSGRSTDTQTGLHNGEKRTGTH
ncbi:hypothetical protein TNCV_2299121 [Trichonephila clavipes]|nr:hypothetical protein TNCV_2299121 [Trichonephila clavipes]